jgi:hypothetical protein
VIQKGGEFLEGNGFGEKPLAVYRTPAKDTILEIREISSKNGDETLEISSTAWPGLTLRGLMPDSNGNFEFTEARILSSHVNGWNEFNLNLLGSGTFLTSDKAVLRIPEKIERVQITEGKIRLKGNRFTGTAALTSLRNRRERILALTEWMAEWQHNNHTTSVFKNQKEFENYWKKHLFPELTRENDLPPEYNAENTAWRQADSVNWNLSYTEYLFPEELWELRNSGAILRDWEEALHWIFIEYSWNMIIDSFDNNTFETAKARR